MSIHRTLIDMARWSVPYSRSPENDVPAGERTPVNAVAWELQGLGGIHYFADGINPNLPNAKKLVVAPEWY